MADQQYISPAFATYGPAYAARMTEWLYSDRQSNPLWDRPAEWHKQPFRVAFLDRAVTFTSVTAGSFATPGTATEIVNIGGGKNVIVFARQASVLDVDAPATYNVLPNEQASYVDIQIQRQSGFIDLERAPVNNNFGFGWSPNIRPVPELWLGNETRQISAFNAGTNDVRIVLTFTVALLDTGR
jgi:hypothetical protein